MTNEIISLSFPLQLFMCVLNVVVSSLRFFFFMDVMWMLQASRNSILFLYGRRWLDGIQYVEYIPIQSILDLKDPNSPLAVNRPIHWRHWPTDFIVGAIIMATKTCR